MSVMRGLTLIVATGDPERFRAALTIAAASAALLWMRVLRVRDMAVSLVGSQWAMRTVWRAWRAYSCITRSRMCERNVLNSGVSCRSSARG